MRNAEKKVLMVKGSLPFCMLHLNGIFIHFYTYTIVDEYLSYLQLQPIKNSVMTIILYANKHPFLKMSSTLSVVLIYFPISYMLEVLMLISHANSRHYQTFFDFCQ